MHKCRCLRKFKQRTAFKKAAATKSKKYHVVSRIGSNNGDAYNFKKKQLLKFSKNSCCGPCINQGLLNDLLEACSSSKKLLIKYLNLSDAETDPPISKRPIIPFTVLAEPSFTPLRKKTRRRKHSDVASDSISKLPKDKEWMDDLFSLYNKMAGAYFWDPYGQSGFDEAIAENSDEKSKYGGFVENPEYDYNMHRSRISDIFGNGNNGRDSSLKGNKGFRNSFGHKKNKSKDYNANDDRYLGNKADNDFGFFKNYGKYGKGYNDKSSRIGSVNYDDDSRYYGTNFNEDSGYNRNFRGDSSSMQGSHGSRQPIGHRIQPELDYGHGSSSFKRFMKSNKSDTLGKGISDEFQFPLVRPVNNPRINSKIGLLLKNKHGGKRVGKRGKTTTINPQIKKY